MARLASGEIEGTIHADLREITHVFGVAGEQLRTAQQELKIVREEVIQQVIQNQRRVIS
ncbi:MAG TPA: hypothetical protein VIF12_02510 [Micavibrio sp.]|jgi:hypothetical protein